MENTQKNTSKRVLNRRKLKIVFYLPILVLFLFSCVERCPETQFKNFDMSTVDLEADSLFNVDSIKHFVPVNVVNFINGNYIAFLKNGDVMLLRYSIPLENESLNLEKTKSIKNESIKVKTGITYGKFGYSGDMIHFSGCEISSGNLGIQSNSGAIQIRFQNKNILFFEGMTTSLKIGFMNGKEYIFNSQTNDLMKKARNNILSGILYKKNNKVIVYMLYSVKNKRISISNLLDISKLRSTISKDFATELSSENQLNSSLQN